jgi:hypothetical protein
MRVLLIEPDPLHENAALSSKSTIAALAGAETATRAEVRAKALKRSLFKEYPQER